MTHALLFLHSYFINIRGCSLRCALDLYRVIVPFIIILSLLFNVHLFIRCFYPRIHSHLLWYETLSLVFDALLYALPFLSLFVLYHFKLRHIDFEDIFYVRKELRRIIICHVSNWSIYVIYRVLDLIFTKEIDAFVLISINIILIFAMDFVCLYISTNWVNTKLKRFILQKSIKMNHKSYKKCKSDKVPLMSMSSAEHSTYNSHKQKRPNSINSNESNDGLRHKNEVSIAIDIKIKLRDILSHERGFESFILHLSSEWSIELLLCLVELSQFQMYIWQYLRKSATKNNVKSAELFGLSIAWPSNIPRSLIVYGKTQSDDELIYENDLQFIPVCKMKAKQLFEKYINAYSEYEVNLPYSVRNRLTALMSDQSQWMLRKEIVLTDLIHIFDGVIEEVFLLMQDAFNRFKKTTNFHKVKALIISRGI